MTSIRTAEAPANEINRLYAEGCKTVRSPRIVKLGKRAAGLLTAIDALDGISRAGFALNASRNRKMSGKEVPTKQWRFDEQDAANAVYGNLFAQAAGNYDYPGEFRNSGSQEKGNKLTNRDRTEGDKLLREDAANFQAAYQPTPTLKRMGLVANLERQDRQYNQTGAKKASL